MWRSFRTSTNLKTEQKNVSERHELQHIRTEFIYCFVLTLSLKSLSPGRCAPPSSSSARPLAERGETQTFKGDANGGQLHKNINRITHGFAANHHDGRICFSPSGLSLQPSQTTASPSPSLCLSDGARCWMVMGAVSWRLNLDSGLGPPAWLKCPTGPRWSLYLRYPRALRGIRRRCWQYHDEGHTGGMKTTSFSQWGSYSWTMLAMFAHQNTPPAIVFTYPLLKAVRRTCLTANVCTLCRGWGGILITGRDMRLIC